MINKKSYLILDIHNSISIKEKKEISVIIDFLNKERSCKNHKSCLNPDDISTVLPILNRLREGYSVENLKTVFKRVKEKNKCHSDMAKTTNPRIMYGENFDFFI